MNRNALLLALVALCALIVIAILLVRGQPVPAELWAILTAAVTGAGVAIPTGTSSTVSTLEVDVERIVSRLLGHTSPAPSPAPAPGGGAPAPAAPVHVTTRSSP